MPDGPDAERGLDGLTTAELRASRRGFWDAWFTGAVLSVLPTGAVRIVDVGCGLASAAHALLPAMPRATYVGVDADDRRLAAAREVLAPEAWADRAELRAGSAERLPCADGEADAALFAMTLQHLADPLAALREVARVVRPGGRLVAVEPDNLANGFYFDGRLEGVTAAFRDLMTEVRRARGPADLAIGPAVASLVERAGFRVIEHFPWVAGGARRLTAKDFLDRVRQALAIFAAGLPADAAAVVACRAAVDASEASLGAECVGHGCQLVPLFVCAAERP